MTGDPINKLSAVDSMVRAIVDAHSPALALPVATATAADRTRIANDDTDDDETFVAAWRAALDLGFTPADAACVARAWQAQVRRTDRFDPMAWPVDPVDFGIDTEPRADAYPPCPSALGLYAVLPDAAWVGRMARAGVPTVQLRFKSADPAAIRAEVIAAVEAVAGTAALLFINDHWREAIDAGAYGVHLGQEDLDATAHADLDAIRRAGLRLGLSTHGYAEMLRAEALAPSYLALGAVFPTTLKAMATVPQGVGRLGVYVQLIRHRPLVAIGGIDAARLPAVCATGVGSVAVVRALVAADAPEEEVARWRAAMG